MIRRKDTKVTPLIDTSKEYTVDDINQANQEHQNLQNYYKSQRKDNRLKTERLRNYADSIITDAKDKYKNDTMGLRGILMADASNRPPTLDDYVKLGLSLSQLSEQERESIQFMLDKSNLNPKDKK